MIQVRNVPDRLHRELVKRAKARGQTLSGFIETILERELERPAADEVFERLRRGSRTDIGRPVADFLRDDPDDEERRASRSDS